jgi:hypothetical protein
MACVFAADWQVGLVGSLVVLGITGLVSVQILIFACCF